MAVDAAVMIELTIAMRIPLIWPAAEKISLRGATITESTTMMLSTLSLFRLPVVVNTMFCRESLEVKLKLVMRIITLSNTAASVQLRNNSNVQCALVTNRHSAYRGAPSGQALQAQFGNVHADTLVKGG